MWHLQGWITTSSEATLILNSRPGSRPTPQRRGWGLATLIHRWAAIMLMRLVATPNTSGRIKAGGLQLGKETTLPVAQGLLQTRSIETSTSSSGGAMCLPIGFGWIAPRTRSWWNRSGNGRASESLPPLSLHPGHQAGSEGRDKKGGGGDTSTSVQTIKKNAAAVRDARDVQSVG